MKDASKRQERQIPGLVSPVVVTGLHAVLKGVCGLISFPGPFIGSAWLLVSLTLLGLRAVRLRQDQRRDVLEKGTRLEKAGDRKVLYTLMGHKESLEPEPRAPFAGGAGPQPEPTYCGCLPIGAPETYAGGLAERPLTSVELALVDQSDARCGGDDSGMEPPEGMMSSRQEAPGPVTSWWQGVMEEPDIRHSLCLSTADGAIPDPNTPQPEFNLPVPQSPFTPR
ncbi:unnamed protein product [Lota lota]